LHGATAGNIGKQGSGLEGYRSMGKPKGYVGFNRTSLAQAQASSRSWACQILHLRHAIQSLGAEGKQRRARLEGRPTQADKVSSKDGAREGTENLN
jgi:hypothetical protein